ncbi:MAG TPA: glycosyltransferase family 2 protein [Anaerolineales bacterium]
MYQTLEPSPGVWVVIPAHNEEKVIGQVLADLLHYPYQILVVDDGSADQTMQAALRYPVTVLRHVTNLGQGAALQTGIRFALSSPGARFIITFDADGQHHASDLPEMIKTCLEGGYDIVLGSRFLKSAQAVGMPAVKRFVLKLAIWFTRLNTGLALSDTHNGLRVMTVEAARKIQISQNGMAHASEILAQIASKKLRFCEVPVTISYTDYSKQKGQSLLNIFNILWDMWIGHMR